MRAGVPGVVGWLGRVLRPVYRQRGGAAGEAAFGVTRAAGGAAPGRGPQAVEANEAAGSERATVPSVVAEAEAERFLGCGWFDSTYELHHGLTVVEHAGIDVELAVALLLTPRRSLNLAQAAGVA